MDAVPGLTPLPPLEGRRRPIDRSPFWLGSDRASQLPVFSPGILDKHAAILLREDGYWLSPNGGAVRLNKDLITTSTRLNDGDVFRLSDACAFRYDAGTPRQVESPAPVVAPAVPRRKRRRWDIRVSRRDLALGGTVTLIVALVAVGIGIAVYAYRHRPADLSLSAADTAALDSLLGVAYDHIERGSTLLEIGAAPTALTEFASGINVLRTSRLRDNPAVVPRIEAMEASVAAIYRERRLEVPTAYRGATKVQPDGGKSLRAVLSVPEFAQRFSDVGRVFQSRYAKALVVTGADHAEHLALYGRGGAIDLRTRDLLPEEVKFLVGEFKTRGVRVKDFSADSILQRQIRGAVSAGLIDRAGTGLHLHVDRFANRRDAFTL
jgi:hypothetical protein